MAFISWRLSLGHTLPHIAPPMVGLGAAGTLAALYAELTGQTAQHAWSAFQAAVEGRSGGVTSDDPFNGLGSAGVG